MDRNLDPRTSTVVPDIGGNRPRIEFGRLFGHFHVRTLTRRIYTCDNCNYRISIRVDVKLRRIVSPSRNDDKPARRRRDDIADYFEDDPPPTNCGISVRDGRLIALRVYRVS